MDAETQSHIYEPFFSTKKVGEGTGLGLSMVYGLLQQSGGYIWVQSALGQGARFEIYLPKVEGVEEPAVVAERRSSPRGEETILLVEDDAGVRELIAVALQRAGYKVLLAGDGASAEGLASSHEGRIDLLVSDLIMPVMGGRELAERLERKFPDLKIIFISGFAGSPDLHDSILASGIPVLQKPFSMPYLARAIRQFLDQSSIPAQLDE
jgi:CheY-like chemotaxis protein